MTFIGGPRREHEAIAANAIRWRRIRNCEPNAAYVLAAWHERQRRKQEPLPKRLKVV